MELTNGIIEKIGVDKLLHFCVGGWFTALALPFNWYMVLIFAILIIGLNFVKEKYLDEMFDFLDLKWCIYGTLTMILFRVLLLPFGL